MKKRSVAPDPDGAPGAASTSGDGSASQAPLGERSGFVTAESVYGIILVSGMIVASGGQGVTSWSVFVKVLVTVIVFWAAHVYAGTVAAHGIEVHGAHASLKTALWLGVVLLAVIGYSAFARLGFTVPMRILGALTTAAFGVAMIVLKAVIH